MDEEVDLRKIVLHCVRRDTKEMNMSDEMTTDRGKMEGEEILRRH
jgi:hypothetical protein